MTQATTAPNLTHKIGVFKGATANDGSVHATLKLAMEHSRNAVIKSALLALAAEVSQAANTVGVAVPGVEYMATSDTEGSPVINLDNLNANGLADFLFANRTEIMAALTQEVRVRKPYVRAKKIVPASQSGLVNTVGLA